MRPDNFNIQQFIDDLQGTCSTMQDHLPDGMDDMDLTGDDHDMINNQIFLCEQCGWWREVCEASEQEEYDGFCNSCAGDE